MKSSIVKRENPGLKKLALAAQAGKKGIYRLSVKILGELISESDAPAEAWLLLGRAHHALKEYSLALAAFNDYIRQKPASGEGYLFAGRTYLTLGMPYRAVPFLRSALENNPGASAEWSSRTKALLGTAYLKSKHSLAAVELLEEAVKNAPEDKRIYRAYLNSLLIRGIRLCRIDDYDLGLQMLRFVLENGEETGICDSPFLRLELGIAARETGNLKEALDHFTAALKLTKGGTSAIKSTGKNGSGKYGDRRIRWARASVLMAMGKNTEARNEIEIIRAQTAKVQSASGSQTLIPDASFEWNSELIDLFMIRSFLETGEWRRAAESCRALLRRTNSQNKSNAMVHALYAEALRNLGNHETAHNHLLRALEEEPEKKELMYADILVCWEGKNYTALKKALHALKAMGGDPDIIKRFTILCQARTAKETTTIIAMLQNAIHTLGPEPELMLTLGEAYLKVGLLEEARSWFKKIIFLKDKHENAWLGDIAALEAILSQSGGSSTKEHSSKELGRLYDAYLARWPDNLSIRRERAMFLVKTFEYTEAASELEKLLAWEPSNRSLRRVLAYTYRKTGRYREAAVFLKALLKEKPRDIGILVEYSGCLERAGAAQYAVSVLEKARELFSASCKAGNSINNSSRKTASSSKAAASKKAAVSRKTQASQTGTIADISLALGILSYRQKNTERAFDFLREAAAINARDPRPYEWMAIIAGKSGRSENSKYYAKEAEKRRKNRNF